MFKNHLQSKLRCGFCLTLSFFSCRCAPLLQDLDFESSQSHRLQIDARNPEQLMKGLEYGEESTTFVSVQVTDVDEPPQFLTETQEVSVPEDAAAGSVLLKVEAKDPEQQEIR